MYRLFSRGRWWGLTASFLLFGGCIPTPLDGSGDSSPARTAPSGGGTPNISSSPSAGNGVTTTGTGAGTTPTTNTTTTTGSTDDLTQEFPDCLEPRQAGSWRAEILTLVNRERSSRGLSTLVYNETLEAQATEYACELIHYDFFDHVNPITGSELQDRAGEFKYEYWIIGENLAAGQRTPAEAMRDWMNSPGHRENILKPEFTELGVGIRSGGEYGTYWVQEFGRPLDAGRPRP